MGDGTGFYVAKHLGIAYVGLLYFALAVVFSSVVARVMASVKIKYNTVDIMLHICILSLASYYIRKLVKRTPYPLDGMHGYDHRQLKEINGGIVISYAMFSIQMGLTEKIRSNGFVRWLRGAG